jgi:hypothetical protein
MVRCPICENETGALLTHKGEDGTRTPEVGFCAKCKLVVVQSDKIRVLVVPMEV